MALSGEERKKFLDNIQRNATEVRTWPAWKRAGIAIRPTQPPEECDAGDCACPCNGCRARQMMATRGT